MDDPAQPRRYGRRIRILLGLSLALNLLVIGAIVGALGFFGDGPERPGAELRAAGRLPVAAMLPSEARSVLRDAIKTRSGQSREERRAESRAYAERLDRALRAQTVDPVMLAALFAERRAQRDARAAEVDAVLVEVLATMSVQQRADFADRLRKRHGRSRH